MRKLSIKGFRVFAILSLLALVINCRSQNNPNKVENPGFETNFTDTWKVSNIMGAKGSYKLVNDVKRSGQRSLKLSKSNSFGYLQLTSKKTISVEPGATYTFRFWFNSSNAQITSFLIPRLVTDNNCPAVSNPYSGLFVHYDYDSQTLMRNSPSVKPVDWVKRIIHYQNRTDKPQEIYIQVMLYGNPFDVYIDDLEFVSGITKGTNEPSNPEFKYTVEQVKEIISKRKEITSKVSGTEGTSHFYVDGKEEWPVFYRSVSQTDNKGNTSPDPGNFAAQGIDINNVLLDLDRYGLFFGKYDWQKCETDILNVLRKNPYARLYAEFIVTPGKDWAKEYPDECWETKDGKKIGNECTGSYSSKQWRIDAGNGVKQLIRDMKQHGYWKLVVGSGIVGGPDWQFDFKPIGEQAADYSPSSKKAWQEWLKGQYKDIKLLNSTWKSEYYDFSQIPVADATSGHESYPPIMPRGPLPDYRQFCETLTFDLRECIAKAIKEESGKEIIVCAYGMPMENQHQRFLTMAGKSGKAQNMVASMSFYPYRQPGFASGYHPEQSFGFHNTGFMQELDLRYFASDKTNDWYNELVSMWVGSQPDITSWRNMHRKLTGISLAQNQGFWYFDIDKQFVNKDVLNEIGSVKKIADQLVNKKGVEFKPDVCLIRFGSEGRYYGSSTDNAASVTVQWQYMLLETSGVPYDIHYLTDIMAEPSLQKYKIYIFHNNTILTTKEREWINANLKSNNRTIIWLYDSGYGSENGLSTENLSALTGMTVKTDEGYKRAIVSVSGTDKMDGGLEGYLKVPEFQGMAEALCGIFTTSGPAWIMPPKPDKFFGYVVAPGVSRYQKFWIEGGYDNILGKYIEDGKAAIAVKRFPTWTSVYVAAPNALAGEMYNNIAKEAGAYRCGPAAMGELRMSGRFVSYHALRSGKYEFNLPKGASKIIDADTGKVMADGVKSYIINGKAQTTYWYFIE